MSYNICYGAKRARKTERFSKPLDAKFRHFELRRLLAENIHTEREEDKFPDTDYAECALEIANSDQRNFC
ncbi:MAG: hypothetical protein KDA64_06375 [Rhodospirillaceae bacterium]|nr:hypothetical protein [Rhodospirillaceae bacterium]